MSKNCLLSAQLGAAVPKGGSAGSHQRWCSTYQERGVPSQGSTAALPLCASCLRDNNGDVQSNGGVIENDAMARLLCVKLVAPDRWPEQWSLVAQTAPYYL